MIWSSFGKKLVALPGISSIYSLLVAGGYVREKLTANRTYYVRTDGSDSNTGLVDSSGGAFLTIQKAYDVIAASIDTAGFTVTIQVRAGTYTAGLTVSKSWTGGGQIILVGDEATPANVIVSAAVLANISATLPAALRVRGFQHNGAIQALLHLGVGPLYFKNITFNSTGFAHIQAGSIGAKVWIEGNYSVSGAATFHYYIAQQAALQNDIGVSPTVAMSGTLGFTIFAFSTELALLRLTGATYSGGTITGTRYTVNQNAVINTNGGGASYFPGNAAGATATGGQYS